MQGYEILMETSSNTKPVVSEILPSHTINRKLTGKENYGQWKRAVKVFLSMSDKQSHRLSPKSRGA